MKFLKSFIFAVLLFSATQAAADEYKIAAIVNGEEISTYTLERRVDLAVRSSGLPNTPEVRSKARAQVLDILIDEKLKEQEAAKLKLSVNEADIDEAVTEIEKQNHLQPGGFSDFLAKTKLPEDSVLAQIKAQLAWKKIVIEKIRPKISVSEAEIQDQAEILSNQTGKKQYDLSEIILKVDAPEKEAEVKSLALKLTAEIKNGNGDFAAIARQFSSGSTAADGGEIGATSPDQLDKKVASAIQKLRVGGITDPIRTDKGFEIFRLNKIKNLISKDPLESEVSLKQIYVPLSAKDADDKIADEEESLETFVKKITSCASYEKIIAAKQPTDKISFRDFGRLEIKNLAPEIRPAIIDLRPGEPSQVMRNNTSLSVFLICDRKDKEGSEIAIEPDPQQVSEMLMGQKIELAARKYMQKLKSEAYIEKRL